MTGFNGWVIADKGYFLYLFWYTKGDGPQEIGKVPKPLKIKKIMTVILALLNTLSVGSPGTCNIILDNLFTSTKLLIYFLAEGFST